MGTTSWATHFMRGRRLPTNKLMPTNKLSRGWPMLRSLLHPTAILEAGPQLLVCPSIPLWKGSPLELVMMLLLWVLSFLPSFATKALQHLLSVLRICHSGVLRSACFGQGWSLGLLSQALLAFWWEWLLVRIWKVRQPLQ